MAENKMIKLFTSINDFIKKHQLSVLKNVALFVIITLVIHIAEGETLELHAYLQHVENGRLGFAVQHVDRENIEPLRALLEQHMDSATLEAEMAQLDN